MRYRVTLIMILLCLPAYGAASAHADSGDEVAETGRLLAILFDSGRVAVGLHQDVINDPATGNKNFTPAVFEKQALAVFLKRTGIDLSNISTAKVPETAKPLLARLLEESKKTIDSYQSVINIAGIKYKGLIPATFGTETANRFQRWSDVYLKQTAPDSLLRNPKNKPDDYERTAFEKFADPRFTRAPDAIVSEVVEEGKTLRVLLPLYYGKACLSCHGEPKGERDISGYPREGAKEGDLGGAISVKLPLQK
jgi:hypothetical protein